MKTQSTLVTTSLNAIENAAVPAAAFLLVAAISIAATQAFAQTPAPVLDRSAPAKPATAAATPAPAPIATPVAATRPAQTPGPTTAPAPITTTPAPVATVRFINIGDKPTVLYDAPSTRANKTFILLRHTPLEILVKLDKWLKVRDVDGTTNGWIEADAIGTRRHVMVNVPSADIRVAADDNAVVAFSAAQNVLFEVTAQPAMGWVAVRHRDGQTGFVKQTSVFGL
jgi:SH3-like domain-containing protein